MYTSPSHCCVIKVGKHPILSAIALFFIQLWGFIILFRCSAGSDMSRRGASGSGGRVLGAVELRGMLLIFVCCCSFPSIALVVTLSLLLCSGLELIIC